MPVYQFGIKKRDFDNYHSVTQPGFYFNEIERRVEYWVIEKKTKSPFMVADFCEESKESFELLSDTFFEILEHYNQEEWEVYDSNTSARYKE